MFLKASFVDDDCNFTDGVTIQQLLDAGLPQAKIHGPGGDNSPLRTIHFFELDMASGSISAAQIPHNASSFVLDGVFLYIKSHNKPEVREFRNSTGAQMEHRDAHVLLLVMNKDSEVSLGDGRVFIFSPNGEFLKQPKPLERLFPEADIGASFEAAMAK